jgi:O-antigen biosynthesis protein WbqP
MKSCRLLQSGVDVKRLFDLHLALCAVLILLLPVVLVAMAVRLTSKGPALYWSDRVGRNNVIFKMPKFRSMRMGTPAVATHLLADARSRLTRIGSFLRKSSLDELPQLWSILAGDMSFVGPRPALFNQHDLIALRTQHGVHEPVIGVRFQLMYSFLGCRPSQYCVSSYCFLVVAAGEWVKVPETFIKCKYHS